MKRGALVAAGAVAFGLSVLFFTGGGHASVFADGTKLEVFVDDRSIGVVDAYSVLRFELPHGVHHVRAGKTDVRVDVDRWFDQVLPIDGQCFVAFDVTNLLYDLHGGKEPPAVFDNPVAARFFESEPFALPERTWVQLSDMPRQMGYAERASVITRVPCSKRDASDEELSDLAPRAPGNGR